MLHVSLFLDKSLPEKVPFILNLHGKRKGFSDYVKLLHSIIFVHVVSHAANLGFQRKQVRKLQDHLALYFFTADLVIST